MNSTILCDRIHKALGANGYKGKIVSVSRNEEIRERILYQNKNGLLDKAFYREWLGRFEKADLDEIPNARSLIIVAAPQPSVKIIFQLNNESYSVLVPPTYNNNTDKPVQAVLESVLVQTGYSVLRADMPEKLLAVQSGLARYGRNNITYVDGMGSYHRLAAFFSDVPISEESWDEPGLHDQCGECSLCQKACPTGAIGEDRFLLHAERCITFFNEGKETFPRWLNPSWHNCIVGCLFCQRVCPLNRDFKNQIQEGPTFSGKETAAFLLKSPNEEIPLEARQKMESIGLQDYYFDILGRNLKALTGL
jgi:epoxyqueuosine reductase